MGLMRRIVTAITAASLAFSLVAMATPANAAVPGYDSAYAGESAFLNLNQGQTGTFTVFFANTGSTSWVKGTGTQVDLAACLEDKVTCNAQDASEATWNSGWLSATRYTSTVQTATPPGSLGTFSYNITAPTGVGAASSGSTVTWFSPRPVSESTPRATTRKRTRARPLVRQRSRPSRTRRLAPLPEPRVV